MPARIVIRPSDRSSFWTCTSVDTTTPILFLRLLCVPSATRLLHVGYVNLLINRVCPCYFLCWNLSVEQMHYLLSFKIVKQVLEAWDNAPRFHLKARFKHLKFEYFATPVGIFTVLPVIFCFHVKQCHDRQNRSASSPNSSVWFGLKSTQHITHYATLMSKKLLACVQLFVNFI